MKGKILGYSETDGTGAISGEDGARYKFVKGNWRGERPPTSGTPVDFDIAEGAAIDIYPTPGLNLAGLGASLSTGLEAGLNKVVPQLESLSAKPETGKVVGLFTGSLATPLALLVLASAFLTAIKAGGALAMKTGGISFSLLGLGDLMELLEAGSEYSDGLSSSLQLVKWLLPLRFLTFAAALWVIWATWARKPLVRPQLVAGILAVLTGLLVILLRSAILGAIEDALGEFGGLVPDGVLKTGFAPWLLLLAGTGLILASRGILRNPLAAKAPAA